MKINTRLLFRKKKFDEDFLGDTDLHRVLNVFDLIAIGYAGTIGSGVYVISGNIIATYAGPSAIISFLLAAICSFLSALNYAELGSIAPKSGSAYSYIYITIGEFVAFLIGWDLLLEFVIGASSTASALGQIIDTLFDDKISHTLKTLFPINVNGLGHYADFVSFGICLIATFFLVMGVKESMTLNSVLSIINFVIIALIVIYGSFFTNFDNWNLKVDDNTTWIDHFGRNSTCATSKRCGKGGFMPFGIHGLIKGTAKCFYAYIGFDCIAASGEEVQDPKRTIPKALISSLILITASYLGISIILTLMQPYYMIDIEKPLNEAFNYVKMSNFSYLINFGAVTSLLTCLYASLYPMPRILYSIANDGLLFKSLSYVYPRFKTPIYACLTSGIFAAITGLLFDLNQLFDMMSIGTLLCYASVSSCIILLRYSPGLKKAQNVEENLESSIYDHDKSLIKRLFLPSSLNTTHDTYHIVCVLVVSAILNIILICGLLQTLMFQNTSDYVVVSILILILIILSVFIYIQPQNEKIGHFRVPLVPFLPLFATFLNVYLMFQLNIYTWARLLVWFAIGIIIYFSYGIRNSKANL